MTNAHDLQWVGQGDVNGCGAACLAMLTGKSYREMSDAIGRNLHNEGMVESLIDVVLAYEGFAVQRILGRTGDAWPPEPWAPSHLVVIGYRGTDRLHYVVMDANGAVLDPGIGPAPRRLADCWGEIVSVTGVWPVAMLP